MKRIHLFLLTGLLLFLLLGIRSMIAIATTNAVVGTGRPAAPKPHSTQPSPIKIE